jgi:hypothetical protein
MSFRRTTRRQTSDGNLPLYGTIHVGVFVLRGVGQNTVGMYVMEEPIDTLIPKTAFVIKK